MTNYLPSDTREIVKSEFVCNLKTYYARDLNAGGDSLKNLPNRLKLTSNARVWVKTRDNPRRNVEGKWLVMDGKLNLFISRKGDKLEVYKRPIIENCALEYSNFLEIDPPNNIKIDFPRYIQPPDPSLIVQLKDRQTQQRQQFVSRGFKLYCVDATVDWRLVVGLGSEHVQETSMTFHHIYGVPYIPGSAVKGMLNHWWFQELQEKKHYIDGKGNVKKTEAVQDSEYLDYIKIFGRQEQRGEVRFLDAFPTEEVHFAIDIMNPHYSEYYSGSKPPTDDQSPRPINFLTVEKTTFRFTFLSQDQTRLNKLKDRFQEALELKGVGAKTSVGYGYFRILE